MDGKDDRNLFGKQKNTSEYDDTFLDEDFGSGDYIYDDDEEDDESLELYDDDEKGNNAENNDKNNIYEDIRKSQLKRLERLLS